MSVMLSAVGNRSYSASSGNVYVADQFGVISNVTIANDINDLEAAGCVLLSVGSTSSKWILTADQSYYVRADGDNANTGLVDSAAGAWLTLQYAYDWIAQNVVQNNFTASILIGAGTYEALIISLYRQYTGPVKLVGNSGDAQTVIIEGSTTQFGPAEEYSCLSMTADGPRAILFVRDVTLQGDPSQFYDTLYASGNNVITLEGDIWLTGSPFALFDVNDGASLTVGATVHLEVSTDVDYFLYCNNAYAFIAGFTMGGSGSINVTTAVISADNHAFVKALLGQNIQGTVTGKQSQSANQSFIDTFGLGLPGDVVGTRDYKEVLLADSTYYVRSDGSDFNDGTADTAGGAWLTIQHAYDWIASNLDQAGYTVTISIQLAGNYVGLASYTKKCYSGPVVITGISGSPYDVVLTDTGFSVINMQAPGPTAALFVNNVRIDANDVASPAVLSWYDNYVAIGASPSVFSGYDVKFTGTCSELVQAGYGGSLEWYSNAIVDMATIPWLFTSLSRAYLWVFLGTLNFAQALAVANESLNASELTYAAYRRASQTGSAVTAKRYDVTGNSVFLQTNVPPGGTAGTTGTGGQVI